MVGVVVLPVLVLVLVLVLVRVALVMGVVVMVVGVVVELVVGVEGGRRWLQLQREELLVVLAVGLLELTRGLELLLPTCWGSTAPTLVTTANKAVGLRWMRVLDVLGALDWELVADKAATQPIAAKRGAIRRVLQMEHGFSLPR